MAPRCTAAQQWAWTGLLGTALMCTGGCRAHSSSLSGDSLGDTSLQYAVVDGQVAFVVWTDFRKVGGSSGGGASLAGMDFRGAMRSAAGVEVGWSCQTRDGQSGAVTIQGQSFDLADGQLFLVSTAGGAVRIRQLRLPEMQGSHAAFERLAADVPDVGAFVKAAGAHKK